MKTCSKCKKLLPLNNFSKSDNYKSGVRSQCKPSCVKATMESRRKNRDHYRNYWFSRAYGLSIEEYKTLERLQGGLCAICKKKEDPLVVDHDHSTERVRGLLCQNCNKALGLLKDSPEALIRAAEYVGPVK